MNFVVIMTDMQNRDMVGAYRNRGVDTPHLDRLAAQGIRFERAYTTCPLCTPARGSIFTGLHPQSNGAWANNMAPNANVAMLGDIFRHYGYRAAYTGKWHLDGSAYFGNGESGGGFEPDWWYDGKRYADDIGTTMFAQYRNSKNANALRAAGFTEAYIWGHRVANRGIDFLQTVKNEPFVLVVSFDEPHGPFVTPPEYWASFDVNVIPQRPNFGASTANKPALQQLHSQEKPIDPASWDDYKQGLAKRYACNAYVDREIGRVVEAVEHLHGDDTVIIYTSDHGGMQGSHSLAKKGPMMYEEVCNIPFIVKHPTQAHGVVSPALVSHIDIIPTMLDLAGIACPERLHGSSFAPLLANPIAKTRQTTLVSYHRFGVNHDSFGGFYPVRCLIGERFKLVINLFDSDEFYDLANDPYEMQNLIDDPHYAAERNQLHDALLVEMDSIRDPFRSYQWCHRNWNSARTQFYYGGANRPQPDGFPFQPKVFIP